MTAKPMRLIVSDADYNGCEHVLFMMKSDDFRLYDPRFSGNYTVVAKVAKVEKSIATTDKGDRYRVYPDWSVKAA